MIERDQSPASAEPGWPKRVAWPALDGLRAVAVVSVIMFHLDPTRSPQLDPLRPSGGFLGVDVFFVLSGFLITSLLIGERARSGRISFGDFYARRALRLLPALAAAIGLALAVTAAVHSDAVNRVWLRPTIDGLPWVLLYVGNWHIVGSSGTITNGALLHTWSLAVEEQYYLLFPIGLWLALRRGIKPGTLSVGLGALSLAVMGWRLFLGHTGAGLDRVYYASDTHSDGLLAGAALAVAVSMPMVQRWLSGAGRRAVTFGAWVGAGLLVFELLRADQNSQPGMELAISVAVAATTLLLLGVINGLAGALRWVLEHPVLRWVGRRSYGLYLYGFILNIAAATWLGGSSGVAARSADVVAFVATFAVAAASYRWVEEPFLARKTRFQRNEAFAAPSSASAERP